MNIKKLKKELNINNADIAKCFDMSYNSFANSTAKERYENALLSFYELAKKAWEKNKTKKQISDNLELSDNKAINYTRCCTQLKDGQPISFNEWLEDNNYIKDDEGYCKGGVVFDYDEIQQEYNEYTQRF